MCPARTPKNAVMPKNKGNLKMLIVGFSNTCAAKRAIVTRCEDSLSVRAFLGYGLRKALHVLPVPTRASLAKRFCASADTLGTQL